MTDDIHLNLHGAFLGIQEGDSIRQVAGDIHRGLEVLRDGRKIHHRRRNRDIRDIVQDAAAADNGNRRRIRGNLVQLQALAQFSGRIHLDGHGLDAVDLSRHLNRGEIDGQVRGIDGVAVLIQEGGNDRLRHILRHAVHIDCGHNPANLLDLGRRPVHRDDIGRNCDRRYGKAVRRRSLDLAFNHKLRRGLFPDDHIEIAGPGRKVDLGHIAVHRNFHGNAALLPVQEIHIRRGREIRTGQLVQNRALGRGLEGNGRLPVRHLIIFPGLLEDIGIRNLHGCRKGLGLLRVIDGDDEEPEKEGEYQGQNLQADISREEVFEFLVH